MEENNTQGKALVINCAVCDATLTKEETLQSYDRIKINAAVVLVSEETAPLFHRYNVSFSTANVVTVPAGAKVMIHNGRYTIAGGNAPAHPTALFVNGALTIEPGACLDNYAFILVNGSVSYPESMGPKLGMLTVNGGTERYPDDAILLKPTFVVDRVFQLRAKAGNYYASRRVVLTDCGLDASGLVQGGTRFLTRRAIVAEPLLEAALPLFGDEVDITVVPEGCAFVNEEKFRLDDRAVRRYGSKLYVNGDLTLNADSAGALAKLEYLRVNGDVTLPAGLAEAFEAIDSEYGELKVVRDVCIYDQVFTEVGLSALEQPGGLSVLDCVKVTLARDIPPQLIRERLDIRDCAAVVCTPEQRDAVEAVCADVAVIQNGGEKGDPFTVGALGEDGFSLGSTVADALSGQKKVINAASYQL